MSSRTTTRLDRAYNAATEHAHAGNEQPEIEVSRQLDREVVAKTAVRRSPGLRVLTHRVRALVHAGRAEGALPSAEVGVEMWNAPLTRPYSLSEAEMYMCEFQQRFPPGAALDARARAMAEEAWATLAELTTEQSLVVESATLAFTDYAQALEERALLQRQLRLLERMAEATRARYSTGGAALNDAARIDVEVAKTQRTLARIEGDLARAESALKATLRLPSGVPLGKPAPLGLETIRTPLADLLTTAQAHKGIQLSAQARERAAAARQDAAQAESSVPEFTLGLGYWQEPGARPGIGLSGSMSLPWLWGPGNERALQAREEADAQQASSAAEALTTEVEITEAHARLVAVETQLRLVNEQAIPSARRSMDALTAAFSTNGASLLEWVDISRSVLDLELELVALRADLARSAANLERAVGRPLPRTPLERRSRP